MLIFSADRARALRWLYLRLEESFGLPMLEAFSLGVPVIA
jgi:hypothetical protein